MLYITTKDFILRGKYEEPMYDEAPYLGTYTVKKDIHVPKNTGIELDENGNVRNIYMDICAGVSVHAGTFTCNENLKELIGVKLKKIDQAEYERIIELKEQRDEVLYELEHNQNMSDYMSDYIEDISIDDKHVSATEYDMISRQMMENATEYIRLLAALTMIQTQIG